MKHYLNTQRALKRTTSLLLVVSLGLFHGLANSNENVQTNLHDDWQMLLSEHVKSINNGHSSELDYAALKQQRMLLKSYLTQLSAVTRSTFDAWPKSKQLAFLINAYNAWTAEFVLTKYPDLDSIKDLGSFFSSPWSKKFIPLLGEKVSLDNIEHDLIRGSGRYNDPRIHFAVNCASVGCPALREEAYTAAKLEQQLNEQAQRFLSDRSRNYVNDDGLYLSSIFKWYGDDFKGDFRGMKTLEDFFLTYGDNQQLSDEHKLALKKRNLDIKFLDYDWSLNDSD